MFLNIVNSFVRKKVVYLLTCLLTYLLPSLLACLLACLLTYYKYELVLTSTECSTFYRENLTG